MTHQTHRSSSIRTLEHSIKKTDHQVKELERDIKNLDKSFNGDGVAYATETIENKGKKAVSVANNEIYKTARHPVKKYKNASNSVETAKRQWQNTGETAKNAKTVAKDNIRTIKTRGFVAKNTEKDIGKTSTKVTIKTQKSVVNSYRSVSNVATKARQSARIIAEYGKATIRTMLCVALCGI